MIDTNTILELREMVRDSKDVPRLVQINNEAFPENERIAVDELFGFSIKSGSKVLGIYDRDTFTGFFIILRYANTVYINYFAIDAQLRNRGYGSKALDALCKLYPDCQIVVDYEAPDINAVNNSQRTRRRSFYTRNGFVPTDLYLYYMETEFESACRQGSFNEQEFLDLYAILEQLADCFHPRFYKKQ